MLTTGVRATASAVSIAFAIVAVALMATSGAPVPDSVTAVAAVAALIGALISIQASRTIARRELTYAYVARANGTELLPHVARLARFLNLKEPPQRVDDLHWQQLGETERATIVGRWRALGDEEREVAKWAQWSAMEPHEQGDIVVFMNFMEELAGAYNLNLLDKPSVKKHINAGSQMRFRSASWFVTRARGRSLRVFIEWERMNADLTAYPEDDQGVGPSWLPDWVRRELWLARRHARGLVGER
jgi:hypothetical protein